MDADTIFNKIWIIESLRPGDLETGKSLYNEVLLPVAQRESSLKISLECPTNKSEFFEILNKIKNEANSGLYPIIHFECHGSENGLQLTSGEIVEWDHLRKFLIQINIASHLNTVIVVAACNGIHLINVSMKMDRAPFWAVIGPTEEISQNLIDRDFKAFYTTFFETLSGDEAVKALNANSPNGKRLYHFRSAPALFIRAFKQFYKTQCIGKGKKKRIENLLTMSLTIPKIQQNGITWARNQIKTSLKDEDYSNIRDRYFMIDLYPENSDRFDINFNNIIEQIES
ncbi:hypothetical protein [Desulfoluna spongiiphila]|uniref:hypothetical protein n=1 Tax=Desulfoluna spongiiphila TaxID=419481 RepID=UPI001252EEC2|nr:hypothetical protein [Desulfoluna spongiiphila]VVS95375.1 hypothetical protein DBB_49520 [Desulfoluna spongiiphila]